MALYDAKERRKVSENFHFDMNCDSVKRMLAGHHKAADITSLARTCVLDVTTAATGDLFLVVKLEKVLQVSCDWSGAGHVTPQHLPLIGAAGRHGRGYRALH